MDELMHKFVIKMVDGDTGEEFRQTCGAITFSEAAREAYKLRNVKGLNWRIVSVSQDTPLLWKNN